MFLLHKRQGNEQEVRCRWRGAIGAPNSGQPCWQPVDWAPPISRDLIFFSQLCQCIEQIIPQGNTATWFEQQIHTRPSTRQVSGLRVTLANMTSIPPPVTFPVWHKPSQIPPKTPPQRALLWITVYLICTSFFLIGVLVACRDAPVARTNGSGSGVLWPSLKPLPCLAKLPPSSWLPSLLPSMKQNVPQLWLFLLPVLSLFYDI